MSNPDEIPHIYFDKKYIGLKHQSVVKGNPTYSYTGGKGIDGCIKHLNNLNTICGISLLLTNQLCTNKGISTSGLFKEPIEVPSTSKNNLDIINEKLLKNEERILRIEELLIALDHKINYLNIQYSDELRRIYELIEHINNKV